MTFPKAKPCRILHFFNSFGIPRQRKNLINGRSGSEIRHSKAPWGPHFTLRRWPPGDLIFHLSKFMLLRRFLRHVGALLVLSWKPSEPSCSPPGGSFGGLLGASQGVSATPKGPDDGMPLKTYAVLPHGHLVNTFFISFDEPSFLNTFVPATIPKVHYKTCIHKDGKKKWGGGGALLGQSIK